MTTVLFATARRFAHCVFVLAAAAAMLLVVVLMMVVMRMSVFVFGRSMMVFVGAMLTVAEIPGRTHLVMLTPPIIAVGGAAPSLFPFSCRVITVVA